MALKATFVADFSSFYEAVQKAQTKLVDFEKDASKVEKSLQRMTDGFSGRKVIAEALLMSEAIERSGGVSRLTATELERVGTKANEAAAKMILMGRDVPPGLQKIVDATKAAVVQVDLFAVETAKVATQLGGGNREALAYVAAVTQIGGASKLTAAEQMRVNSVLTEALAKYKALGQEAPPGMKALADATKQVVPPTDSLNVSFGKLVASYITAQAIIGAVKGAFSSVVGAMESSITAANEAEKANVQMVAALRAQGTAVPSVISAFEGYGKALQQTTVFQDDAIEGSIALLVQVGNVMPRDMKKALEATTNLASGLGKDLTSATMLVAKAAEGNTAALQKAGVVIDQTRAKQEGFGYVLDQITEKFGGQAAAIAGTYQGRLQQLANTWNNVQESVGRVITQNETLLTALDNVNTLIASNTGELNQNRTAANLVSDAVILTVKAVSLFASTLDTVQTLAFAFKIGANTIVQGLDQVGIAALTAVKGLALMQGNTALFALASEQITVVKQRIAEYGAANDQATGRSVALGMALDAIGQRANDLAANLEKTRGNTKALATAADEGTGAWNRNTRAVKDGKDATDDFAKAMANINAVGARFQDTIDSIDGTVLEGIKYYIKRGDAIKDIATMYGLLPAKVEALKRIFDAENKVLESGALSFKTYVQAAVPLVGLLPGLESGSLRLAEALITVSSAADSTAADLGKLQRAGQFLSAAMIDVNKSIATLPNVTPSIGNIGAAIADVDTKSTSLSTTLGGMSQTFANMAQIGGPTFSQIARDIGLAVTAAEALVNAMQLTGIAQEASSKAGAAASGGVGSAAAKGAATVLAAAAVNAALAWVGVGIAIWEVWSALKASSEKAWQLELAAQQALAAASQFYSKVAFSDSLTRQLVEAQNNVRNLTGFVRGLGAEALVLTGIVRELGGVGQLTDAQYIRLGMDISEGLKLIAQGGPLAAKAITEIDGVLVDISKNARDANGLVNQFFLDMVAKADAAGIKLEQVAGLMKQFGQDAIKGFNAVIAGMGPQLKAWDDLKARVDAAREAAKGPGREDFAPWAPTQYPIPMMPQAAVVDVEELEKAYKALGLTLSEDFIDGIKQQNALIRGSQEQRKAIDNVLEGLTAMFILQAGQGNVDSTNPLLEDGIALYARLQAEVEKVGGTTKDALAQMQPFLKAVQTAALRSNQPLNEQIQLLINQSRQLGLWKETALDAFLAARTAGKNLNLTLEEQRLAAEAAKGPLEDLGIQAVAAFAAAVAGGASFYDALAAVGPGLEDLQKAFDDLGISTNNVALQNLLMQNTILKGNPQLLAAIQGLVGESTALFNMGLLNAETFAAMERTGAEMYGRLQAAAAAAGGGTKDALLPMQEWLRAAAEQAKRLGIPLDENTQQMIDQSKELGIWKEIGPSTQERMISLTQTMVEKMEAVVNLLTGLVNDDPLGATAESAEGATAATDGLSTAVDNVATMFEQGDWSSWGYKISDAAKVAQDAIDSVSFGSSPGGIKEIPLQFAAAMTAARSFARVMRSDMNTAKTAVDVIKAPARILPFVLPSANAGVSRTLAPATLNRMNAASGTGAAPVINVTNNFNNPIMTNNKAIDTVTQQVMRKLPGAIKRFG